MLDTTPWKVSYTVELLDDWVGDATELIVEEARERELPMPLNPDSAHYQRLQRDRRLLCLVARNRGQVIGYILYVLFIHPHFRAWAAEPDLFFVAREYRGKSVGPMLLKHAEKLLRARSVKLMCAREPYGARHGALYQRYGFKPVETLYLKTLE